MLVDQLPVGHRRFAAGQPVDDDPAGDPPGRGQAGVEGGAADRLQYQVCARAAGQSQDLGGDVAATGVDDVVGAQRQYHLVLGWRGRGNHRGAEVFGHLHGGLAGPAGRGVDQHGLPRGDAAQRFERRQRGWPVHDQAQGLLVGPARRHRQRGGYGQHQVLGEGAAGDTDADDVGAGLQVSHPLANGGDFTHALDARQVRRLRAAHERAAGLGDVDEVDAGGGDPDQDLARARARYQRVGDQA
jgi:hypothetical protein